MQAPDLVKKIKRRSIKDHMCLTLSKLEMKFGPTQAVATMIGCTLTYLILVKPALISKRSYFQREEAEKLMQLRKAARDKDL